VCEGNIAETREIGPFEKMPLKEADDKEMLQKVCLLTSPPIVGDSIPSCARMRLSADLRIHLGGRNDWFWLPANYHMRACPERAPHAAEVEITAAILARRQVAEVGQPNGT
jgi:hypothetical protein